MIVRSILVTALNLDLGSRIWWPSRMDRAPATADPDPEPERVNA
jgi:RND superfamily putative drug exporter